jgi:hypothetical protein
VPFPETAGARLTTPKVISLAILRTVKRVTNVPNERDYSRLAAGLFWVGIGLLGAAVLSESIEPIDALFRRIPRGYNEGWNAYWAHAAWNGGILYPPADSAVSNNYPPASFYIVGTLGHFLGDDIIAGRVIALVSLFAIAANIGIWLRAVNCSTRAAILGTALFAAAFGDYASVYIARNDPQLLAHALILSGATVLWRLGFRRRALIAGSVLMVLGGLTKHLLIAMPLATTLWICLYRRDRLGLWLSASVALIVVALVASWLLFGVDFFTGLSAPRSYKPQHGVINLSRLLSHESLTFVLAITVFLLFAPRMRLQAMRGTAVFALLYLVLAAVIGTLAAGGAGVDHNAYFDLIIAACLALAVGLEMAGMLRPVASRLAPDLLLISALAMASGTLYASKAAAQWPMRWQLLQGVDTLEAQTTREIHEIRSLAQGRAVCEDLALCYWSGMAFSVDLFNFGQKLETEVVPEEACDRVFSPQTVTLIELDQPRGPRLSGRLPRSCNEVIAHGYTPVETSVLGTLMRRK